MVKLELVYIILTYISISHNFTAAPQKYFCDFGDLRVALWTFGVPMLLIAVPSVLFALHTVTYLVRHHFVLRRAINIGNTSTRNVPFELGHCLRLVFFCIAFGAIVIMLFAQQVIEAKDNTNNDPARREPDGDFPIFSDFSDSVGGIIFSIIFGTTRAALDTLGYILSCGCIRTRLERRRHRHDPRAVRLMSTSSSLGRRTTGAMTLQEAMMDVDLESNLSTLTSLPADTSPTSLLPLLPPTMQEMYSTMQEMHSTMLFPTAAMSPYVIHPLVAVPAQIYNPGPDFKNYPK
ncbi:hypothetical protein EC957_009463 [Mortierella hygrophila]|uniref:Uncharacterized protein n=1 Tax=Mortierella hygrophila TaxID=979708 RepID=A0A9P6FB81_9FUNG|nr:hypothetical protein EC957_009463 [Mortierella hygrophila]